MTIKKWNVDSSWQEPFVSALRDRGADGKVIDGALERVDMALAATGKDAQAVFGDPAAYASTISVPETEDVNRSRELAIGLAVAGLIGMFLALWGWTGIQRDAHVLGLPGWIPFIIGLLLAVGAAATDLAMGARSDVYAFAPGERPTPWQTFANKFAPWLIVLLTLIGVLLIWLKYA